jgi:hypothetical protein
MRICSLVAFVLLLAMATVVNGERHIIVADHENGKVIKIKDDGTLLWEARNDNGHDVQLLPNGNLLIICGRTVREITPEKKVVHEIGKPVVEVAESAQRLANGNTVIADTGRMRVIEVDPNDKVVWEFKVPNNNKRPNPTMRQIRRLDSGNTLICASTEDTVLEVDQQGKVVWHYDLPFPYLATRLANGNTLISSGDGYGSKKGYFVIEVDPQGKEVWKYGGDDAPPDMQLPWPSGHVRLANGNTLISLARGAAIREVSPDKKTVRVIRSPAMKHPCTLVVVDE